MFLSVILGIGYLISNFFHWVNPMERKESNPVAPRAYFISPSGNDKNAGTRDAAFQSIQRLNSISFNPGDSVLFEGGRHFAGSLVMHFENNPVEKRPVILISSYGHGYATLNAGKESALDIEGAWWMEIKKLVLSGSGRKKGNVQDGLRILNSQHVTVDSLNITGFQKSGLHIDFSGEIIIKHIYAHENGFAGISVGGSDGDKKSNYKIYIGYCRAENNPGDPSNLHNHSGNGIIVSGCMDVMIEYCTATNNGWDMPRKGNGPVGIWAYEADSVIIQHCLSYRNKTSVGGADGGGFDLDGGVTHSIVQYCLSYENQGAGYCLFQYLYASPWHDNIFRYNISENDGAVSDAHGGVYLWNSAADPDQFYNSRFYNNTIYNAKGSAVVYSTLSKKKGFAFYNNIFVARDSLLKGNADQDVFQGNDWWNLEHRLNRENRNGFESGFVDQGKGKPPVKRKISNRDPHFLKAGKAGITSATSIKQFDHYKIPLSSPLRNSGIYIWRDYGIPGGVFDFNGKKPPAAGIGACF
jgi:hypothetical protein